MHQFNTLGGPLILCSAEAMATWPGGEEAPYAETLEACVDWITLVRIKNVDFYVLKGPEATHSCTWQMNPTTKGGLLWRCIHAPIGYTLPRIDVYSQARQVQETLYNRAEKHQYAVFDSMFSGEEARFAETLVEMTFPIYFVSLDTYQFKVGQDVHFIIHSFRPIGPAQRESTQIPNTQPRIQR